MGSSVIKSVSKLVNVVVLVDVGFVVVVDVGFVVVVGEEKHGAHSMGHGQKGR